MSEDNVTPTFAEAVGNETPEATPAETPEVTPTEGEETPQTPTEEVKVEPTDPPQEHDWKKRFDGVDQAHRQLSESHKRVIEANVKLVEKNPDVLEDLAEADPTLADEVSNKIHGKSFKDYVSDRKLEDMKDEDPDGYSQELRLRELERDRDTQRTEAQTNFYKEKGISVNEFDPKYQKVQEQLSVLDKAFVKNNPVRALEIAHSIAFPPSGNAGDVKKAEALAGNTSKSGGSSSVIDHGTSSKSPEAQAFSNKFKELTAK